MDDSVLFDDLGPSKAPPASVYDDMFDSYFNRAAEPPEPSPKASSSPSTPPPVFDKPVFDDDPDTVDPFEAIPLFGDGGGGAGGGEDFLGSVGRAAEPERREPDALGLDDDLIPGLVGSATKSTEEPVRKVEQDSQAVGLDDDLVPGFGASMNPALQMEPETLGFDDGVIPGFGGGTSHQDSAREEPIMRQGSEPISSSKMSVSMPEDPFVILGGTHKSGYLSFGLFSDHLGNNSMPVKVGNTKVEAPDDTGGMFQSSDIFAEFPKAIPSFSFTSENKSDTVSHSDQMPQEKPGQRASTKAHNDILPEVNIPGASAIHEIPGTTVFQTLNPFAGEEELLEVNQSSQMPNEVWITVSDISLVTQPTSAPPPSRPPPPLAAKKPPTESVNSETYILDHHNQGYHHSIGSANASKTYQIDDLEDFFMAKPANFANGRPQVLKHEGKEQHSSAATASFMDWTEMGHSKGGNQGTFDSMFTSNQYGQPIDEKTESRAYEMEEKNEKERLEHERIQREHEEEQRKEEKEREKELEREREREREEELEREKEKVRQKEQEERKRREKEREARQAVEKAVWEARERAAAEARMQAEKEARKKAERAAVQKATAEARERAAVEARERAAKAAAEAKEREAAEARERATKAAADARERAARAAAEAREKAAAESQEKAAAEARAKAERAAVEKAAAEARRRAERAAFERVAAEARQRAANEARERAAAEARARENQQSTTEPDLESFFGMPSRSSSVPRSHTATTNPFDVQPQGNAGSGAVRRTSSGSVSPFTQPPPSNLVDDLSSVFGAPSSSAVFQEVRGESEERRKARLERHQRTMERAAKALAEKNERDLQAQREQEERHRIGESLDFEIKRWAAGKEGNLRALLSTLQYLHLSRKSTGKRPCASILIRCSKRVQIFNKSTSQKRCLTF
uniref:Uncharacterized protein n=1 Tax=Setaria italica TaxID=4555 RepID=K3XEA9_SETIT